MTRLFFIFIYPLSLSFSFLMQPLLIAGIAAKILPLPSCHRLIYMQRFVAAKFPAANRAYYHQPIYTVIHFIFTVIHTDNSVSISKYKWEQRQAKMIHQALRCRL